ncbi:hypothetical protein BGW36DRAFT_427101 [Talaromyces proteolyticus]|uniref:Uncharacterized protein n=1 Tax=Talaromyces proteolyticus TaxID=1131652 RepID=A0AAD4PZZ8_9EURO|nr:uncharacterized protein BGW36DRAFT_427101 [Talaromyces proteolyticus]KAH8697127.1 hypothetical protein BGW36DRAFT_427101 [Talaromyces proteolyticus]
MTATDDSSILGETDELLRFLNRSSISTRDSRTLRGWKPPMRAQSLGAMKIHEQMDTESVTDLWKEDYERESQRDTKSSYKTAEPMSSHQNDNSFQLDDDADDDDGEIYLIEGRRTPDGLKPKRQLTNYKSTGHLPDSRLDTLDEGISIYEDKHTPTSSLINCYLQPDTFSQHMEPYTSSKTAVKGYHRLEECPFYTNEVSALKFRIVELEYVNASLEGKLRQYRDEIRLFKKDVRGYKTDGKRFTQLLKEKNVEISVLHKKIIQLLNHDAVPSPRVSAGNPHASTGQMSTKQNKVTSGDFSSRSRVSARASSQVENEPQYWV